MWIEVKEGKEKISRRKENKNPRDKCCGDCTESFESKFTVFKSLHVAIATVAK